MTDTIIKSHKIRLARPTNEQRTILGQAYGASRFCYNQAKALSDQHYADTGKSISKFDLRNRLVREVKPERPWLYELPKSILEEAAFDYHTSLKAFFKRGHGMPGFRSRKRCPGSFTVSNSQFWIDGRYITVVKLGKFKLTEPLRFEGKVLSATFSERGKHHYVSVTVEVPKTPAPQTGSIVGIDLNIHSIDTSDGLSYAHEQHLRKELRHLAQLQRSLARKVKGSNNRRKAALKVNRAHERVANRRKDAHHKLSTALIRDNSFIGIEDLNVAGMVKNRRLARSISDAAFSQFRSMLTYKASENNRVLISVDRWFPSSKTCSGCGWVKPKLNLSDRVFRCEVCGLEIGRDLNAALNIRAEMERLLSEENHGPWATGPDACGEDVRPKLELALADADLVEAGITHQTDVIGLDKK